MACSKQYSVDFSAHKQMLHCYNYIWTTKTAVEIIFSFLQQGKLLALNKRKLWQTQILWASKWFAEVVNKLNAANRSRSRTYAYGNPHLFLTMKSLFHQQIQFQSLEEYNIDRNFFYLNSKTLKRGKMKLNSAVLSHHILPYQTNDSECHAILF